MVEIKFGPRRINLPFAVFIPGVTNEKFDELVTEDIHAELINGVMVVPSPATPRHNKVAGFLRSLLEDYGAIKDIGEVFGPDDLIHLTTCRRFAPDGFFLSRDRVPVPLPEQQFEVVPNLVIEVLSEATREIDLEDKRPAFHEAGVEELWFIDQEEEVVIVDRKLKRRYRETEWNEGHLKSAAVPGFWINVDWLWADPLPKAMKCLQEILK